MTEKEINYPMKRVILINSMTGCGQRGAAQLYTCAAYSICLGYMTMLEGVQMNLQAMPAHLKPSSPLFMDIWAKKKKKKTLHNPCNHYHTSVSTNPLPKYNEGGSATGLKSLELGFF